jgi:ribosome-associated heat shock protein Hsp15
MAPDRKSITNKPDDSVAVRLDVWLDVACLFRTRSEAQRAIKGGKVALNDHRGKSHREIHAGDRVCITRTNGVKQLIEVLGIADRHVSKHDARTLYADRTPPPSEEEAAFRALIRHVGPNSPAKMGIPNKRQRRQLRKLKEVQ